MVNDCIPKSKSTSMRIRSLPQLEHLWNFDTTPSLPGQASWQATQKCDARSREKQCCCPRPGSAAKNFNSNIGIFMINKTF
jgi:hypothetical protein